ncbi:RNA polymerase sigma factor [Ferruginibacter sp. HRS2-29]|uniref:RNA polymerase sigma factor n=1 Tax=Ferruginibacter sp. HRS2-29 TaxID=2487334 RepID=UPI0020CBE012|nr:RNA polymerase sigma factor [Ferruginibacter sp. HRS2-29]MCP9751139.1 RNA polymerase sigma factor [Ferruginibacter sp. HRS2-29]
MISRLSYKTYRDEELLPFIKKGYTAAFDELYERYGQKLFSYFFRMLWKNKELAEDCTQDIFIKLIKHAEGFDETRNFSTWIYSIANNMCKNEYRKKEVRVLHQQLEKPVLAVSAVNPDMRRFREAVHSCTNELPEEKKALYILRFQENLSVPDISSILGIPEGTIKSRIFYLLKEMKEKLRDFETLSIYP